MALQVPSEPPPEDAATPTPVLPPRVNAAPTAAPTAHVLELLRERTYRNYWLSNFCYFLGFGAQRFAFVLFVLELTDRAGLGGLVGFALGVPAFFITVPAGVWADRFDRKRMTSTSFAAGAVLLALLSAATFAGLVDAAVALGAALAVGFVTASVMPPMTAIVPMIVPADRLVNGIVLRTMGQNLAQFVGAVTGGVTIAAFDYGGAFAFLAGLYLLSLLFMRGVTLPEVAPPAQARPPMRTAAAEGGRFVFGRSELRALVIASIMTGLFQLGPIFVLVPELARTKLEVGAGLNSLLLAFTSIGMLAMSAFLATRSGLSRKGFWFLANLLIAGPAIVLMGLSDWYALTALALLIWGLNGGVHINLNQTLIQLNTPNEMMGRVMSIYMLSIAGLIPLGSLLSGAVAEVLGADGALISAGIIFSVYSVIAFATERSLRELD
ncbi:MAG: MFS transporter [Dehalococcoidia bacterium]|nr:MFS transporter [Dehalococcoidia bacterium]